MDRGLFKLVEKFRDDRLKKINEGKGPCPLGHGKLIIHLVPAQSLRDRLIEFDLSKMANDVRAFPLFGEKMRAGALGYNLEGRFSQSLASDNPVYSYVQFFRNMTVEAAESFYLNHEHRRDIPIYDYEEELFLKTSHYIEHLGFLGVEYPVIFLLSILGAAKYGILGAPLNKDEMLFVPKEFTEKEHDPLVVLRPTIYQLWQAAGKEKQPRYGQDGKYNAR